MSNWDVVKLGMIIVGIAVLIQLLNEMGEGSIPDKTIQKNRYE